MAWGIGWLGTHGEPFNDKALKRESIRRKALSKLDPDERFGLSVVLEAYGGYSFSIAWLAIAERTGLCLRAAWWRY